MQLTSNWEMFDILTHIYYFKWLLQEKKKNFDVLESQSLFVYIKKNIPTHTHDKKVAL